MTAEELRALNDYVLARFTYRKDPADRDQWRSSARLLAADPDATFTDDCDGLAMTVAELAHMRGASDVWRLVVSTRWDGRGDHMVAAVRVEGGDCFVVGDTNADRPVPLRRARYRILVANHIASGLDWVSWAGRLPERASGEPGSPS